MQKSKLLILILAFIFCFNLSAMAEEFKVFFTYLGLQDESKVEEQPAIDVDLSNLTSYEEKAEKVGEAVLKRELEGSGPGVHIVFILNSIRYDKGLWYLDYKWDFKSLVASGEKPGRFFKIKVDFAEKRVVHERSADDQYTGP